jgi:hypothetical protein
MCYKLVRANLINTTCCNLWFGSNGGLDTGLPNTTKTTRISRQTLEAKLLYTFQLFKNKDRLPELQLSIPTKPSSLAKILKVQEESEQE